MTSGVTLAFLLQFIDDCGGREVFRGLTTEDVCYEYIMPLTAANRTSYVEQYTRQHPESADFLAPPATWYLGHTWQYRFLDVVDSITSFVYGSGDVRGSSFFFCIFCANQHSASMPFVESMALFRAVLNETRGLVLVIPDLADPVLLTRAWCLFEIFIAHCGAKLIEVASVQTRFLTFGSDPAVLLPCIEAIATEASEASVLDDEDMILHILETQMGFEAMDHLVLRVLTTWFAKQAATASMAFVPPGGCPGFSVAEGGPRHPLALLTLTDLPDCSVVDRVRQSQRLGAVGAVLFDSNELTVATLESRTKSLLPGTDNFAAASDVAIPAILIGALDAARLQQLMANISVVAALNWAQPHPESHVNLDVYFPATLGSQRGWDGYASLADAFGPLVQFTPHFEVYAASDWGCANASANMTACTALCNGVACTFDPEDDLSTGHAGTDVLTHDMLLNCLFQHTNASVFWAFHDAFGRTCRLGDRECADRVLMELHLLNADTVMACTKSDATAFFTSEIQRITAAGITTFPMVTINDQLVFESWACNEPISMTSCPTLAAVCRHFEYINATVPDDKCSPEYWLGRCLPPHAIDDCGICAEPDGPNWNAACIGCDGVANSNKMHVVCAVVMDLSTFVANGDVWGLAVVDACGVCDGHGSFDACGLCFEADDPRRQNYGCQLDMDPDALRLKLRIEGISAKDFGRHNTTHAFSASFASIAATVPQNVHIKSIESVGSELEVNIFLLPPTGVSVDMAARLKAADLDVVFGTSGNSSSSAIHVHVLSIDGGPANATVSLHWYFGAAGGVVGSMVLTTWLVRRRDRRMRSDMRQLFARYTPLVALDEEY
ncbi:hypothetical protein ACHHYP_10736 [Achlya hypogyna]|uniref:Vacuolar sorting receptor thioredoxin-like domain-containing protein n=1 Tax=Achlya hypogyna TaxID=1202772 RepID=A0A1V9ZHT1_ACHHY|nr:hypothetical protein ACHHYP_10736 [Achlya hypogyna]